MFYHATHKMASVFIRDPKLKKKKKKTGTNLDVALKLVAADKWIATAT